MKSDIVGQSINFRVTFLIQKLSFLLKKGLKNNRDNREDRKKTLKKKKLLIDTLMELVQPLKKLT